MAINTIYMDNGVLKGAANVYKRQFPKNIRLEKFFQPAVFSLLQDKLYNSQYHLKFHPYKHKYSITKIKEIDSFLHGRYFDNLIRKITGIEKYKISYEIRKFEAGNFTLLHDSEKEKSGVDFVIDFSKSLESFGGHTVYLTEAEELLTISPSPNTLSFVERAKGVMKFTKYVQHRQKHPIVQVAGTVLC